MMKTRKLVLGLSLTGVVLGLGAAGITAASASTAVSGQRATGPAPYRDRDGNVVTGPVNQAQPNGDVVNATLSTTVVPLVQAAIALPPRSGESVKTLQRASGQQIYRCSAGHWVFDHPEADSVLNAFGPAVQLAFHHDRGPIWVEQATGTTLRGQSVASAGGNSEDIPQLLLKVVETSNPRHAASSVFNGIEYIQRLDTVGGTVNHITTTCTDGNEGELQGVDYSALYAFFNGDNGS